MENLAGYFDEPFCFEFCANVMDKKLLANGNVAIELDKTYFFPTGGGQDCDFGTIENVAVLDVAKNEAGNIVHVIEKDIQVTNILGKIDKIRRISNMQHHTAQHLISQIFWQLYKIETTSAKIYADKPTYIDFATPQITERQIKEVESYANDIIFSGLQIKSYFVDDENIRQIPIRRDTFKATGNIRIVEIDKYEYSACGGTHCTNTGQLGIIKILKTEKVNQEIRLHFVAGRLAFEYFNLYQNISTKIATKFNAKTENILNIVNQISDENQNLSKEIQLLKQKVLPLEAQELILSSEEYGYNQIVRQIFTDRNINEIRQLTNLIIQNGKTIAILGSTSTNKFSLIVACAPNSGVNASELLKKIINPLNGKGGGNNILAQGGGDTDMKMLVDQIELIVNKID